MHSRSSTVRALDLASAGDSATAIAEKLGIPRRTVADWLHGRVPRRADDEDLGITPGCGGCDRDDHAFEQLPPEYVHLLGLYLGDGCLSLHPRRVFKLRITLDSRYPEIIREASAAMAAVIPRNRVAVTKRKANCVDVYSYAREWPCLFPQHGPGRKHARAIILEPWQLQLVDRFPQLLLRGLIQSDGCRFVNTGRGGWRAPRYRFDNLSTDIRGIFCSACDRLGLHWTTAPRTVYVSRRADVARMDEFVGPKR